MSRGTEWEVMDLPLRSGKATRPKPQPPKPKPKKKPEPPTLPFLAIAIAVGGMTNDQLSTIVEAPTPPTRDMQWRYRCAVTEQERRSRGCKGCGAPVERGYWCSDSCFYAEDGWTGTPEQEEEQDDG